MVWAANFGGGAPLDPGEMVIVGVNGVLRAVIGAAAPGAVPGEVEVDQVLVAIRHTAETDFVFPVPDVFLGRFVVLPPVVAARIEVVELGRASCPIPTETND